MKKKYLRPWLRVVEINGDDIVSTSGEDDKMRPMSIELDDYDTYNGEGTRSDF